MKQEKRSVPVGGRFSQFRLHCPRPRPRPPATLFQHLCVTPIIKGLCCLVHLRPGTSTVSLGLPGFLPPRIGSSRYLLPHCIPCSLPRVMDATVSSLTGHTSSHPSPALRTSFKTPIKPSLVYTAVAESSLDVKGSTFAFSLRCRHNHRPTWS